MSTPDTAVLLSTADDSGREGCSAWDAYWERLPCRHTAFRAEAACYVEALLRAIRIRPDACVLDFGCGTGLVAAGLAPSVARVALWDRSAAMRRRARIHVAEVENAVFVDLAAWPPPLAQPFDLVLVNSVVQYMSFHELCAWMPRWRSLLAPGGLVVLSDVLPARSRRGELLRELVDTLALQAKHRTLIRGVGMRLADLLPYAHARRATPLTRIEPEALAAAARARGFAVESLARNLTCRRGRASYVLSMR